MCLADGSGLVSRSLPGARRPEIERCELISHRVDVHFVARVRQRECLVCAVRAFADQVMREHGDPEPAHALRVGAAHHVHRHAFHAIVLSRGHAAHIARINAAQEKSLESRARASMSPPNAFTFRARTWVTPSTRSAVPSTASSVASRSIFRSLRYRSGMTTTFTIPVSSSRVANRMP